MNKIAQAVLLIVMFSLFSQIVEAEYPYVGGTLQSFQAPDSTFNRLRSEVCGFGEGTSRLECYAASYSNNPVGFIPLTSNFDGEGSEEIIVLFSENMIAYSTLDLHVLSSITLENKSGQTALTIYDYDGDGINEIIVSYSSIEIIDIYNLSNSSGAWSFYLENSFYIPFPANATYPHTDGTHITKCRAADECMSIMIQSVTADTNCPRIYATSFNKNGVIDTDAYMNACTGVSNVGCFATIPSMMIHDIDQDGKKEYIVGYYEGANGVPINDDKIVTMVISQDSQNVTLDSVQFRTIEYEIGNGGYKCHGDEVQGETLGRLWSGLVLANTDGSGTRPHYAYFSNQDEITFVKIHNDNDHEKLNSETTASNIVRGMSNIAVGNYYPASYKQDLCVMVGLKGSGYQFMVSCYSPISHVGDMEWGLEWSDRQNITYAYWNFEPMISSSDSAYILETEPRLLMPDVTADIDEIVSMYGILSFPWQKDWTWIPLAPPFHYIYVPIPHFNESLRIEWELPAEYGNGVPILNDNGAGTHKGDYILGTQTHIVYLDDSEINYNAYTRNRTYDPCIHKGAIKNGSQMTVYAYVADRENDRVSMRVTLYQGTDNQQVSAWTSPSSSNKYISISTGDLKINRTISAGTIRLEIKDVDNYNNSPVIYDETFSVDIDGWTRGDGCITVRLDVDPQEIIDIDDALCITDDDCEEGKSCQDGKCIEMDLDRDNAIQSALLETSSLTGMSPSILYLFFMAGVSLIVVLGSIGLHAPVGGIVAGVLVVDTLLLIIGAKLALVSGGIIVVMSILLIFLTVSIVGATLWGGGGGGG